jgi:hypothetical protein
MFANRIGLLSVGVSVWLGASACSGETEGNKGTAGAAGSSAAGSGAAAGSGNSAGNSSAGNDSGGMDSGGSSGTAGAAGAPEIPEVEEPGTRLTSTDKVDVLFVVDNSVSMSGMPNIISKSAGPFLRRLINPRCVDATGKASVTQPENAAQPCASGYSREFAPVKDMHIGAISSSLGSHGGNTCSFGFEGEDDKGRLLPSVRSNLNSWQSDFVTWNATGSQHENASEALITDVTQMLVSAGSSGCGFEAQLESMYRFLIDPEPPLKIVKTGTMTAPEGIDETLLAQRKAFLRGDSAVAIVMVTDENDCSVQDEGLGWLITSSVIAGSLRTLWRSTSVCATNPNDICCRSCASSEPAPPSGCAPLANDVECKKGANPSQAFYTAGEDVLNMRCWDQKRRYGFDLLYPTSRYVNALTKPTVTKRDGSKVTNPLFAPAPGKLPRSSRLVSFTGILGVPWQDVSKGSNAEDPRFLNAQELAAADRWKVILGDPTKNIPPSDPLMIESAQARSGLSPILNQPLAPTTSTNPRQNAANGHEYNIPAPSADGGPDDLQYACIFELAAPIVCDDTNQSCDCSPEGSGGNADITARNKPVCQPPTGGAAGSTQYYGKAYPGLRPLAVLKALGERGVVASVCPRSLQDSAHANYGYVPALQTLAEQISPHLK